MEVREATKGMIRVRCCTCKTDFDVVVQEKIIRDTCGGTVSADNCDPDRTKA